MTCCGSFYKHDSLSYHNISTVNLCGKYADHYMSQLILWTWLKVLSWCDRSNFVCEMCWSLYAANQFTHTIYMMMKSWYAWSKFAWKICQTLYVTVHFIHTISSVKAHKNLSQTDSCFDIPLTHINTTSASESKLTLLNKHTDNTVLQKQKFNILRWSPTKRLICLSWFQADRRQQWQLE